MGEGLMRATVAARLTTGKGTYRHKETGREVRVMGVLEGYVVARHKGAVPFVTSLKDFIRDYGVPHEH